MAVKMMKIQLDQNGNSYKSPAYTTKATGILLSRKGRELTVEIGNRATPHAVFAALTHLRSIPFDIYFKSTKSSLETTIPLDKKLNASDSCLYLSRHLLQLVESRQNIYITKEFKLLTPDEVPFLPVRLNKLCNFKLHHLDTATALSLIEEAMMADISFIVPSGEMNYAEYGYQVRKIPQELAWPTDELFVPLAFTQLLPAAYAAWYNSLCHSALCVRRPLIHRAQMKLTLQNGAAYFPADENEQSPALPSAEWYDVTRIIYPLASHQEKPSNFRLLLCSIIDGTEKIIL